MVNWQSGSQIISVPASSLCSSWQRAWAASYDTKARSSAVLSAAVLGSLIVEVDALIFLLGKLILFAIDEAKTWGLELSLYSINWSGKQRNSSERTNELEKLVKIRMLNIRSFCMHPISRRYAN